jgi:hypothetical protein
MARPGAYCQPRHRDSPYLLCRPTRQPRLRSRRMGTSACPCRSKRSAADRASASTATSVIRGGTTVFVSGSSTSMASSWTSPTMPPLGMTRTRRRRCSPYMSSSGWPSATLYNCRWPSAPLLSSRSSTRARLTASLGRRLRGARASPLSRDHDSWQQWSMVSAWPARESLSPRST